VGQPGLRWVGIVHDAAHGTQLRADPLLLDQALRALALHLQRALPPAGALAISAARRALDPDQARRLGLEAGDYLAIAISGPARGPALPGGERALDALSAGQVSGDDPDLGLILAAAIIGCMDGGLTAGDAAGPCTALTAYLPVAMAVDASQAATPLRLPALGGRETVLLVEDDPALLGLVGDSLRHHGYQLLTAGAGEEALRVAERHAGVIDLLLTDVVLPQLGGHALAAQLVQLRKDLRVVLMSGFPSDAFSANREFAHAAFLAKPFTIDELMRTVRSALDAGRTAAG
jgi:CheY-like chemotaxis protein